jgi:hypothetical protein
MTRMVDDYSRHLPQQDCTSRTCVFGYKWTIYFFKILSLPFMGNDENNNITEDNAVIGLKVDVF